MKQFIFLCIILTVALSGCQSSGPGGGSNPVIPGGSSFDFITGRSWTYTRQDYDSLSIPRQNSLWQDEITVLNSGQTIGGLSNAAVLRVVSTRSTDGRTHSNNIILAVSGNKILVYNGTTPRANHSPTLQGWTPFLDLRKDGGITTFFSFDSTYILTMLSGNLLMDRVTYTGTTQYAGDEVIAAFGANITCSKYNLTFTYDAKVDTASTTLLNTRLVTIHTTIWFANGIGIVKTSTQANSGWYWYFEPPYIIYFSTIFNEFDDFEIIHTATDHGSSAVSYHPPFYSGDVPHFGVFNGPIVNGGSSVSVGFSKNFTP